MVITSAVTIMEDYGWIDPLPFNLMFIGAVVEVIVFSVALTFLMRGVYQERNELALRIARHQRELIQSYVDGSERERQRVSRELHDDIGSRMSHVKRLLQAAVPDREALQAQLEKLVGDVRTMAHRLAAPPLLGDGLVPRLQALAAETQAATGTLLYVQSFDFPKQLSPTVEAEVYRIVQEAIENIVKHAQATEAYIQLFLHEQDLTVTIEDNGKGFLANTVREGIGLTNMRMRAESAGGRLELSSGMGQGTTLIVVIPYRAASRAQASDHPG
jgi:signal transduction histidine kinase